MDHSPRGSSVHGILQERTQEWVAMPTPSRSSRPSDYIISLPCLQWQVGSLPLAPPGKPLYLLCAQPLSCVRLFVIPWTVARQAPLSMGFSRQEQWSGLPFLIPGDLPDSVYKAIRGNLFDKLAFGERNQGGGRPYSSL